MATHIPESFRQRAQQRQTVVEPSPDFKKQSTTYIPETFRQRARQKQEMQATPLPIESGIEIYPGVYEQPDQLSQGIFETTRDVIAPGVSEAVSSLIGLPIDIIESVGGFEGSPISETIKEYGGSSGIKKIITEPLRKKLFGDVADEESMETQVSRRFGRLAGPGALAGPIGLAGAAIGAGAGQYAQEKGYGPKGQAFAEIAGMIGPQAAKNIVSLIKTPKEVSKQLIMPRVGPKGTKVGIITPERQQKAIQNLNKEASSISKKILEEKQPLIKQIEQGIDFESEWKESFGKVKQLAEKANPHINISPTSKFMYDKLSEYSGIPELGEEAKKIVKEVRSFGKNPPQGLNDLLKTYRENNVKVSNIYETSRVHGKQQKYVDFLMDYNKSIVDSIKTTLPKDSPWVKLFEDTNKKYKAYKDAQAAENLLKPILGEEPTIGRLIKYGSDPRMQKKLSLYFGKDGAEEISKLASDLKIARESIKKIPVKEISKWDAIFPLGYFIPGGNLIKIPFAGAKLLKFAKFGYGRFLTGPKKTAAFQSLVKAFNDGDKKAYALAAKRLIKELDAEHPDEWNQ